MAPAAPSTRLKPSNVQDRSAQDISSRLLWQCQYKYGNTYRTTSLRGLAREMRGKRKKHMTKQASAAKLQAPNISIRSHRLTMALESVPAVVVDQLDRGAGG